MWVYFVIGRPMISFLGDADKFQAYVNEKGMLALLVFGLFVAVQTLSTCIPGLPFYLAAGFYSGENLLKWSLITFIARFPHIFIYTFGGEKLVSNQYGVLLAGAAIAIIVYLVVDIVLKKKRERT